MAKRLSGVQCKEMQRGNQSVEKAVRKEEKETSDRKIAESKEMQRGK